ncbi:MAG: RNA methyltransferase [Acidimicrobiia bacterium]|nr:RNA methyltransferase [Acidimicrobiia bacterium]
MTDRGVARLSPRNPRLQRLRRLSTDRRFRTGEGAFVVEGPHLVADAVAAGLAVAVFVEPDVALPALVGGADVEVHLVEPGALGRVTDATTSQGIAAVATRRPAALEAVEAGSPVLVLVEVGDPGNAGTLLRSAEAAGFGAVLFTRGSVDPWSPKCVRASAGAVLRVPVIDGGEAVTVLEEVAATGRRRIGSRARSGVPHHEADLPPDVALVLGSEAHGLPAAVADALDGWVSIPMAGGGESLNVAMAGTILCFEVARRRG